MASMPAPRLGHDAVYVIRWLNAGRANVGGRRSRRHGRRRAQTGVSMSGRIVYDSSNPEFNMPVPLISAEPAVAT